MVSLEYREEIIEYYEQLLASKSDNLDETKKSLNTYTHTQS